jgi:AcrR family transcriptional regulator
MGSDRVSEVETAPSPLEIIPARQPQQRRSHAGYERMIVTAGRLLEERDFDAVSIRDLAGAAGCSIGSFYYRFQTKERFFQILTQLAQLGVA